jgi:excinuclease UvrABC nuclease subunit
MHWELFSRNKVKFVPVELGCYVLATFNEQILYVGLAVILQRRLNERLVDPAKTKLTAEGRATKFFWLSMSMLYPF